MKSTRLFEYMPALGFSSVRELARALGLSHSYLSQIRRGERGYGLKFYQRVMRLCGGAYSARELFPEEDEYE